MRITAVSTSNPARVNAIGENNNYNNPSFKKVLVHGLKMHEIENLYEDGPAIARMIRNVKPAFEEKLGKFFDLIFDVKPNFDRFIRVKITTPPHTRAEVKKHILNNNKKIFHFPRFVTESFRTKDYGYENFLDGEFYGELNMRFDVVGEKKGTEKLLTFMKENDVNSVIKKLYKQSPPKIETKTNHGHYADIYGNPAV